MLVDIGTALNIFWRIIPLLVVFVIDAIATCVLYILGFPSLLYVFTRSKNRVGEPWRAIRVLWLPWCNYLFIVRAYWNTRHGTKPLEEIYREANEKVWEKQRRQPPVNVVDHWRMPEINVSLNPLDILSGLVLLFDFVYYAYLLAMLVIAILPVRVAYVHFHSKARIVVTQTLVKPEYRPSETQVQEKSLGPWLTPAESARLDKSKARNLALLSDVGEIRYSQRYTASSDDPNWTLSLHPKIRTSSVKNGMVTFVDDRDNTFIIAINEPFQFENMKMVSFMFSQEGLKQALTSKLTLHEITNKAKRS